MARQFTALESKMLETLEAISHLLDDCSDEITKNAIIRVINGIFEEVNNGSDN